MEFVLVHHRGSSGFMEPRAPVPHHAGKEPHAGERKRGAQSRPGLGNEATAAGAQSGEYFSQRLGAIPYHHQQPAGDDGIHWLQRLRESQHVGSDEMTVLQMTDVRPILSAGKQALRKIDAGYLNVRVSLGETAGVEAGATGYFKKVGFRTGPLFGPKGVGYGCSVIAEQVLTTECVEP